MGLLDIFKSKKKEDTDSAVISAAVDIIDDMSYIADMKHIPGPWHQYDFLLASEGYGWDYMVDSADYMTRAELEHIGTVSVSRTIGEKEEEYIDEFNAAGGSIKAMKSLAEEASALGLGGMSKIIGGPVKIVWFNQTKVIRIFTPRDDEDMLIRFTESIIRRNFKTPDAMKKARPVSQ